MTVYVLREDSSNKIVSFAKKASENVTLGYTETEEAGSMGQYESRFILGVSLNVTEINLDVTVTVMTNQPVSSIILSITTTSMEGEVLDTRTREVTIISGSGSFTMTATQPCLVTLKPADETVYTIAGRGLERVEFKDT